MQERQADNRGWLLLLLILIFFWHKPILKIFFVLDYQNEIIKHSQAHQLDSALVGAMVFVESKYNPKAISHKGAMGLMQIMPNTGEWAAKELGVRKFSSQDLLNPELNLRIGTWYLDYLKRYFSGNHYLALASYNAGHRNVLKWVRDGTWSGDSVKIEQIPFPETKKYLIKVLFYKKIYNYLYPELANKTI